MAYGYIEHYGNTNDRGPDEIIIDLIVAHQDNERDKTLSVQQPKGVSGQLAERGKNWDEGYGPDLEIENKMKTNASKVKVDPTNEGPLFEKSDATSRMDSLPSMSLPQKNMDYHTIPIKDASYIEQIHPVITFTAGQTMVPLLRDVSKVEVAIASTMPVTGEITASRSSSLLYNAPVETTFVPTMPIHAPSRQRPALAELETASFSGLSLGQMGFLPTNGATVFDSSSIWWLWLNVTILFMVWLRDDRQAW
ncbi:hypothetical protein EC973_006907 [Apophysomyces ossiformis]|uniref:Uncharacterized protein n=1 Tax=Apophysomyces ossiformis TaxID=679940 RepID=A0A8H7ERB6_9FUNG|nr:hypothetical protein EC973_006907 [Apophysomyces ossiformis]